MNRYEAMIIFPESLKDNALEELLGHVKDEIKKLGGEVESATRLGKRAFSRRMKKQDAGNYAMLAFKLPGGQVLPLQTRFKLNESVFRLQVVRAKEPAKAASAEKGRKSHGDAK